MAERLVRGAIINELLMASRYGLRLANEELRADGVDPWRYGALSFIGVMQPVTRTELTYAVGEPRTTVRDLIRGLIELGHVREVPNPRDRRSTLLELTPKGQEIFDRGKPAFRRALARLDEALDGRIDEHEEVVWRVRIALQELVGEGREG
jgi:DNA-binding MarR family transcriptional regulator